MGASVHHRVVYYMLVYCCKWKYKWARNWSVDVTCHFRHLEDSFCNTFTLIRNYRVKCMCSCICVWFSVVEVFVNDWVCALWEESTNIGNRNINSFWWNCFFHTEGLLPAEELSGLCWKCSCFLSTCRHSGPLSAQLLQRISSQNYPLPFVFDGQPNTGWASSVFVEFSIFLWMLSSPGKGYEKSFKRRITGFACLCCRNCWQDSGSKDRPCINVMY